MIWNINCVIYQTMQRLGPNLSQTNVYHPYSIKDQYLWSKSKVKSESKNRVKGEADYSQQNFCVKLMSVFLRREHAFRINETQMPFESQLFSLSYIVPKKYFLVLTLLLLVYYIPEDYVWKNEFNTYCFCVIPMAMVFQWRVKNNFSIVFSDVTRM